MKKVLFLLASSVVLLNQSQVYAQNAPVKKEVEQKADDKLTEKEKQAEIVKLEAILYKQEMHMKELGQKYAKTKTAPSKQEANKNFFMMLEMNKNFKRYKELTGEVYSPYKIDNTNKKPNTNGDFNSSSEWIEKIQNRTMMVMGTMPVQSNGFESFKVCNN